MPNKKKRGKGKNAPSTSTNHPPLMSESKTIHTTSSRPPQPIEGERRSTLSPSTSQAQSDRGERRSTLSPSTSQSQSDRGELTLLHTESTVQLPTALSRLNISSKEVGILETKDIEENLSTEESESTGTAECERDLKVELSDRMVITDGLPLKQSPGKMGRPVKLISNLYSIDILPEGNVYHYDVEIVNVKRSEETELASLSVDKNVKRYRCLSTKVNRKVIERWLQTDEKVVNSFAVYDGQKNLYSPESLRLEFPYEKRVDITEENIVGSVKIRDADRFKVIVKPVSKRDAFGVKRNDCAINLEPLYQLFAGKYKNVKNCDIYEIQQGIMALETIFRHTPALKFVPIGRSFFHPYLGDLHPLGGGIEIWFGYHQSMRLGQWKPLINLNTTATTFFANTSLLEYFCGSIGKSVHMLRTLAAVDKNKLKKLNKELKNIKIKVNYQKNNRKYTIIELTQLSATRLKFDIEENGATRETTVQEYLLRTYKKQLDYPNLPCVRVKPENKKIYIPIECCIIAENQHCKKELEKKQKAEMIKYTAQPPPERFNKVSTVRTKHANYEQDEYLKRFEIEVSNEPLQVTGRTLAAPSVMYENNTKCQPRDGSWNIIGKKFVSSAKINSWYLLSLATHRDCNAQHLRRFSKQLQEISENAGIEMNDFNQFKIIDENYRTHLDSVFRKIDETFRDVKNKNYELVIVVIPDKDKKLYNKVKLTAEVEVGVMTQCVAHDTVISCNKSTLSNLCQKINAKKGGVNHTLCKGEIPSRMSEPTIIIGADVSHPSVTDKSQISVAAVAGSLDMVMSRFAVCFKLQKKQKQHSVEKIQHLQVMVKGLLISFFQHTRNKPRKIIFYRDGVSDGEFLKIKGEEVAAVRAACTELEKDYKPAITFAVVQKRHHVRTMPKDIRDGAGRERNVKPGTVIDTGIVHPINRDFFLYSHLGLKGTSRPGYYTILHDDSDFSPDEFQAFTNYMCYTFSRCTKSISHPVPVRYAHLAAYRTRLYLSQIIQNEVEEVVNLSPQLLKKVDIADNIKKTMYFV